VRAALLSLVVFWAEAAFPREIGAPRLPQALQAASRLDRHDGLILKYAQFHGLDPRLVKALIAVESEFDPRAVSRAGALGLMQLMPATGREMGVHPADLSDPEANIRAGTAYLARLFREACRRQGLSARHYAALPRRVSLRVLAAYNAGPAALKGGARFRLGRSYARKVLRLRQAPQSVIRAQS
jgi:soluble lytic murein transglycosylase-like protein